jgi:hypothetical protein
MKALTKTVETSLQKKLKVLNIFFKSFFEVDVY